MNSEKLWSMNFVLICLNNLLYFLAVNIVSPTLPVYLTDSVQLTPAVIGVVIAANPLGALILRPYSGYLSDNFPLLPLFILTSLANALLYPVIGLTGVFFSIALIRFVQGLAFSVSNTAQNTIAVSIIPSRLLGSGIGIFSSMGALGMVFGPMIGIYVMNAFGAQAVLIIACLLAVASALICLPVRFPARPAGRRPAVRCRDLILFRAIPSALCFIAVMFPYGMLINFTPVFVNSIHPGFNSGMFFFIMGIGLLLVRVFCGRLIDNGHLKTLLICAKITAAVCLAAIVYTTSNTFFLIEALILGASFGVMSPGYQTVIVRMADISSAGKANSTFFIAMDLGMLSAMFFGGMLADALGYDGMFLASVIPVMLSLIAFIVVICPKLNKQGLL